MYNKNKRKYLSLPSTPSSVEVTHDTLNAGRSVKNGHFWYYSNTWRCYYSCESIQSNPPRKFRYSLIMAAKIFICLITAAQAAMKNIHSKESVGFRFRRWWGVSPRLGAVAQVSRGSEHSKASLRALGLSPNKATLSSCKGPQDIVLFCPSHTALVYF